LVKVRPIRYGSTFPEPNDEVDHGRLATNLPKTFADLATMMCGMQGHLQHGFANRVGLSLPIPFLLEVRCPRQPKLALELLRVCGGKKALDSSMSVPTPSRKPVRSWKLCALANLERSAAPGLMKNVLDEVDMVKHLHKPSIGCRLGRCEDYLPQGCVGPRHVSREFIQIVARGHVEDSSRP
jgi:hypothetical protein